MIALKEINQYIKKLPKIQKPPKEYLIIDIETVPGLPSEDTLKYFQDKRWNKKIPKEKKSKKSATPEDIEKLNQKLIEDKQAYDNLIQMDKSIEPSLNSICCITLRTADWVKSLTNDSVKIYEPDMLNMFWQIMNTIQTMFSGLQIVTFNGLAFDFPVIEIRSAILNIPHFELPKQRYRIDKHFDVRMVLASWDKFALGDLHFWAGVFGIKTDKSVIKSEEIYEYYKKGDMKSIVKHCEEDTRITEELYLKLR